MEATDIQSGDTQVRNTSQPTHLVQNPNPKRPQTIKYIPFSQINLHKAENPTAHFYYAIEQLDENPYIAFVQEPYCSKGIPKHLPGNGVTYHYQISNDVEPRASLTAAHCLAERMFQQNQFTNRDMVTCTLDVGSAIIYIASIYMDVNMDIPQLFIELTEFCMSHKHGLIVGVDTNANHTAWGCKNSNNRGRTLINQLARLNLYWANNGKYTFKRNEQETAIDLTLTNEHSPNIEQWDTVPSFSSSDHVLIEFIINLERNLALKATKRHNSKKCDWNLFRQKLKQTLDDDSRFDIGYITQEAILKKPYSYLNKQTEILTAALQKSFIHACPTTHIRHPKKLSWWTPELTEVEKTVIENKIAHESNPEDNQLKENYNIAQKKLRSLMHENKDEDWKKFCTELTDISNISKVCKALTGTKSTPLDSLRKSNGEYTKNPQETLETLSGALFTQTNPNMAELAPIENCLTKQDIQSIISYNRLTEAIRTINKNKAEGEDKISNIMLFEALDVILVPLLNIYRLSLKLAKIPIIWQTSKTAILAKPGKSNYQHPKSFRIITLSSCTLKVMEKLILWYLQRDLKLELALSEQQHGFRKGCSTESAILQVTSIIETAIKNGNQALGIFMDIEGAFDNIPFVAIKSALERTAAKGNISNWILHLVTTRNVTLRLKDTSYNIWVKAGCPQGGVLSPFLWNLVLDSLLVYMTHTNSIFAFADDLVIILASHCTDTLQSLGQIYTNRCNQWCKEQGLKISVLKTSTVIFSRKRKQVIPKPIKLNGVELMYEDKVKYLGVYLDKRLNWHHHINKTSVKSNNVLFACNRMIGNNWGLTPQRILWVYNVIIVPIITYACIAWSPKFMGDSKCSTIKPLQKPGNLSLIMATGALNSTSQQALHMLLDILPIELELEKKSLLTSIRIKSQEHWPKMQGVDPHIRKSVMPATTINDKILNNILNGYDPKDNDLCKPADISSKNYTLEIQDRQMEPEKPTQNLIIAYTDGSKHKDNSTGSGYMIHLSNTACIKKAYTLQEYNTVFQCEAYALIKAASEIATYVQMNIFTNHRISIYTDSQALIKTLKQTYTTSKTIKKVHETLNTIPKKHLLTIDWIPGHQGHIGNETADLLANLRHKDIPSDHPLKPHAYYKNRIKEHVDGKLKATWQNNTKISSNTYNIINSIITNKLGGKKLLKLDKDILMPLTRLITGHNNLNYFINKLDYDTEPYCRFCEERTMESRTHLIMECSYFSTQRMDIFGEDPIYDINQVFRTIKLGKLQLSTILIFVDDADL